MSDRLITIIFIILFVTVPMATVLVIDMTAAPSRGECDYVQSLDYRSETVCVDGQVVVID